MDVFFWFLLENLRQVVVHQVLLVVDIVWTEHLVSTIGLVPVIVGQPRSMARKREHQSVAGARSAHEVRECHPPVPAA